MTGWRYAGLNMAFFLGGLMGIPTDSIEASIIDGANYWQKLRYIYIAQIIPSIVMATVTCLIGSFNLIDELFGMGAMYGNRNAVFLSVLVFQKGFVGGKYLNLYNNHLALILLGAQGGAIPVMIFTSYISTIPEELRESVEIDGGTRLTYFIHILLPNMKTPFASYMAIILPNVWNNMINGILYLAPEKQPITALISSLIGTYATNYQAMYSGLFMSAVPILAVYLVIQNLFVKSAMLGAVKG